MNKQIPETIASQIGGVTFMMMGTQKRIASDERTLRFNIRGSKKCNWVQVYLNYLDLYDITFEKFSPSKFTYTEVGKEENVFCGNMRSEIEKFTGLYLSF